MEIHEYLISCPECYSPCVPFVFLWLFRTYSTSDVGEVSKLFSSRSCCLFLERPFGGKFILSTRWKALLWSLWSGWYFVCPDISLCVTWQSVEETSFGFLAMDHYGHMPCWHERETKTSFPSSTGLSLQAKQHAEKAKEILTSSIAPPYNDNTDVFRCSIELFHTLGRALLSLQKYPFDSNLYT